MSVHQIVCTEQTPCTRNGHIIAVGIGPDRSSASQRLSVPEVYSAMRQGHTFYTADQHGNVALVQPYDCPCGRGSLRSTPDASVANNLDSLRLCAWR